MNPFCYLLQPFLCQVNDYSSQVLFLLIIQEYSKFFIEQLVPLVEKLYLKKVSGWTILLKPLSTIPIQKENPIIFSHAFSLCSTNLAASFAAEEPAVSPVQAALRSSAYPHTQKDQSEVLSGFAWVNLHTVYF